MDSKFGIGQGKALHRLLSGMGRLAAENSGGAAYGARQLRMCWGISEMEEPATAFTVCDQLTTTLDLQRVAGILEEGMPTEGLLERKIVR